MTTSRTSTERSTTEAALDAATNDGLRLPYRRDPILPGHRSGPMSSARDADRVPPSSDELYRVTDTGDAERVAALADGGATCVHVHEGVVFVGGDDAGLWRLLD